MRKRLFGFLSVVLLIILCAGCVKPDNTELLEKNVREITAANAGILPTLSSMDILEIQQLIASMSDNEAELSKSDQLVLDVIDKWLDVQDELGEFISFGKLEDIEIVDSGKEISGTTEVKFSKRNMDFTVTLNKKDLELTSVVLTPIYSKGEALQRAGMNMILGMGTVFAVLILISIIIYLFGFIGKWQNKKKKIEQPVEQPVFEEEDKEDVCDDLELVAVIMAAIAASEDVPVDSLVVRSIKRKKNDHGWKNA